MEDENELHKMQYFTQCHSERSEESRFPNSKSHAIKKRDPSVAPLPQDDVPS
jgi:hypothetical protein